MRDYRLCLVGLAAWVGALTGHTASWAWVAALALLAMLVWRRLGRGVVVAVGAAALAGLWLAALHSSGGPTPLTDLASAQAQVQVVAEVEAPPHPVRGRFGTRWVMPVTFQFVNGRGASVELHAIGSVSGETGWQEVTAGTVVEASGRLVPGEEGPLLAASGPPSVRARPGLVRRGAESVRASIRRSVSSAPEEPRALLPALVDGERTSLSPQVVADFQTTGLTHLAAVSGTNVAIVVGFVIIVVRRCGVRGRGLTVAGAVAVMGFVAIAGPEPSVLRAAVMGSIGLVGMADRDRGLRALGGAVLLLVLFQTPLAWTWGFALSVAATAGILILGPDWRDGLMRWLPRSAAEAIAVPAAAQLACTPLVAVLSGQVSLVAILANVLAEPAVGPATILGLTAGLVGLVAAPPAAAVGAVACLFVRWILWVAHRGADFPQAAIGWGRGAVAVALLIALTWLMAAWGPRMLRHRWLAILVAVATLVVITVRAPVFGWPPAGWVLVACDVGQGDALVLRTGDHDAVVIDAGPDPDLVDSCLTHLRITRVRLLVVTHLHNA